VVDALKQITLWPDIRQPEEYFVEKPKGRAKYKKPIELYGPGPPGETCKTCDHCNSYRQSRKWYKCGEWIESNSSATDIRLKWPACGKWEKEQL
jgi:hypothetical protein